MAATLTTTQLAYKLGISAATVTGMRKYGQIPADAAQKIGRDVLWDEAKVFAHLRKWKVSKHRIPNWLHIVGHPDAEKYAPSGDRAA